MDVNDNKEKDHQTQQENIYNNLKNKNFTSIPNYSNDLYINNPNISPENKNHLKNFSQITKFFIISPLEILYKEQHNIFNKTTNEREKCSICYCEFYEDIIRDTKNYILQDFNYYFNHKIDVFRLYKCEDHFFHIDCFSNYIKSLNNSNGFKCPNCQKQYGIIKGEMPPGKMSAIVHNKKKCEGYPNNETIIVNYKIKSGIFKGKNFTGTNRISFIPNTKNGRILLGLLKIAFDRQLTFAIGTSITTGMTDTIVWNGIHHKTNINGGPTNYGYPDPTYFNRVLEELASKGVNKDDYDEKELEFLGVSLLYG